MLASTRMYYTPTDIEWIAPTIEDNEPGVNYMNFKAHIWLFSCDFLPAPIYRKFDVRDNRYTHIHVDGLPRAGKRGAILCSHLFSTVKLEVPVGKIFLKQNSVGSCSMRSQELPKKVPLLNVGRNRVTRA